MNLKKGTPGKGRSPRPDSFSYTPVASGLKNAFTAFLAGPIYWAEEAHEHTKDTPGTKPCLHWLTDGAVPCVRCRKSAKKTKCIGWAPLYREVDLQPIICIVHESASDNTLSLKYPELVMVGRVTATSSVFIRRAETQVRFHTESEHRRRPVDITDDLLNMWQLPDLNDWLKRRPSDRTAMETPPVLRQRLSVPPPTTDVERLALDANRADPTSWDAAVAASIRNTEERKKRAEKNGQHTADQTE